MRLSTRIGALTLTLLAAPATAQDAPPPPPLDQPLPAPGRNPAVSYLMQTYNLGEAEAQERIDVQNEIVDLTNRVAGDAAFASIVVQHQPAFKVIVSFADKSDRKSLNDQVSPKLRRYLQLRVAKRARSALKPAMATLQSALGAAGGRFVIGYDARTDTFVIDAESQTLADRLKTLVPVAFADDVRFQVRPIPVAQAAPTGVRPGDYALAGYAVYGDAAGNQGCTLAFPVTYGASNTKGILTAGHCTEPKLLRSSNGGDHYVTFSNPPDFEKNDTAYDYAIYNATGMTTTYQVYYRNLNGIPEFASSGWLNTRNFIRGLNQVNGMIVCKSGAVTGITCGEIIDDAYAWRPGYWFIKVSHTKQFDISNPGDSGGPWFLYPGSSADVTAAGIHNAGSGSGANSIAVYMPIDRTFEHVSNVKLVLKP